MTSKTYYPGPEKIPPIHQKILYKGEIIKFGESNSVLKYQLPSTTKQYLTMGFFAYLHNREKLRGTAYLTNRRLLFIKDKEKSDKVGKSARDQVKLRKYLEYSFPFQYLKQMRVTKVLRKEVFVTGVLIDEKIIDLTWEVEDPHSWFEKVLIPLENEVKDLIGIDDFAVTSKQYSKKKDAPKASKK
ncbi:MAG: hypothetical protein ACW976_06765 [Candidatus Ranarchaeia archaeon]|jgi:hypothetical protein